VPGHDGLPSKPPGGADKARSRAWFWGFVERSAIAQPAGFEQPAPSCSTQAETL
jgi:hypothetical protein